MIGLLLSIFIFNLIAFTTNKRLTVNQILHIWCFTTAFQMASDVSLEFKYYGYWYFTKKIEWSSYLAHTVLIPPVNIMFLNWFPFGKKRVKQILYILFWTLGCLLYELLTLLPEPYGYFHYGWWNIWHSAIEDPILLVILLVFYKLICNIEKKK
ncbi:hypothetical protein [Heyndrickxia ginsengihumi]|uniref:Uncharacterized protein n=1 Tax=Heyndrickxia ginsengihumi TaxID=363870 RepID=A0A6M0P6H2_9BACI|nr:hypothetical protein [Heyndrickxia ginsengihumi]MBE6184486.1 hypothetical protein [Bacillus sp. (in: firmicutes)]MCM3023529.1 hypothetical protein [Heyndrickxia ginsengihumi]NEY20316.1 hypothetical protein [Heyndrickxia ginsengihumi]